MAIKENGATEKKTPAKTTRKKSTTSTSSKSTTKTTTRKASRPKVDLSKEVLVINMSQASFIYTAKKGNGFLEFEEYLDSDYMTIEDLQIMKNSKRGVFEKGWLYIDDEEAVEYLGLQKYMKHILLPEQMEEFFELDVNTLKDSLQNFSSSIKENIYQTMKIKYELGELTNAHIIKAVEESLSIDPSLSILND